MVCILAMLRLHAGLQPLLARSSLTQDLAPVSCNLSQVAVVGLQALDDLKQNRPVNAKREIGTSTFLTKRQGRTQYSC